MGEHMKSIFTITAIVSLSFLVAACGKDVDREYRTPAPIAPTGAQGASGDQGAEGERGQDGSNGSDGVDGTAGLNSIVNIVASTTCLEGGVSILSGLDLNSDNVLDVSEVTSAKDVCNGSAPARKPGLSCNLHNLSYNSSTVLPAALASNPPVGNFTLPNFNIPDSPSSAGFPGMPADLQALVGLDGYALDCSGYLYVPTSGIHTFSLLSDDGARLVIEDNILIQNQGIHAPTTVTATNVNLNRGWNRINVVYFQGPHTQIALELKWTGPNTASQVIPAGLFTQN